MVKSAHVKHVFAFLFLLLSLFITMSCNKNCAKKDGKLSIKRTDYYGSLKINGCYYYYTADGNVSLFFFYRSGTVVTHTVNDTTQISSVISVVGDDKYDWGAFIVSNDNIRIEGWELGRCGYPVYVNKGIIIDDSTIAIKETFGLKDNENYRQESVTLRFKRTVSKPDSTQPYL